MIDGLLSDTDPKPIPKRRHQSTLPDNDIHRFDELMNELNCPINTDDYATVPLLGPTPVEPTFSVVEVPKPCDLARSDPDN